MESRAHAVRPSAARPAARRARPRRATAWSPPRRAVFNRAATTAPTRTARARRRLRAGHVLQALRRQARDPPRRLRGLGDGEWAAIERALPRGGDRGEARRAHRRPGARASTGAGAACARACGRWSATDPVARALPPRAAPRASSRCSRASRAARRAPRGARTTRSCSSRSSATCDAVADGELRALGLSGVAMTARLVNLVRARLRTPAPAAGLTRPHAPPYIARRCARSVSSGSSWGCWP